MNQIKIMRNIFSKIRRIMRAVIISTITKAVNACCCYVWSVLLMCDCEAWSPMYRTHDEKVLPEFQKELEILKTAEKREMEYFQKWENFGCLFWRWKYKMMQAKKEDKIERKYRVDRKRLFWLWNPRHWQWTGKSVDSDLWLIDIQWNRQADKRLTSAISMTLDEVRLSKTFQGFSKSRRSVHSLSLHSLNSFDFVCLRSDRDSTLLSHQTR